MEALEYICKDKNDQSFFQNLFGTQKGNFNVRTNIFGGQEFTEFLKVISAKAKVHFVVYTSTPAALKRYEWSKTYMCHHGGQSIKKYMGIKKNTWRARTTDKHLESYPCLISCVGEHSHEITTLNTLGALPVLSPTKRQLEEHFRCGLGPSEAKVAMTKQLQITQRADSSLLPKPMFFYQHYNKYSTAINGDLGGLQMHEAVKRLMEEFPDCKMLYQPKTEALEMSLCLVTPLMQRVLKNVPQASEIVFMDTTSHVDLLNSNVTLMLTWSPAGGLPIGVFITESQTEESYCNGLLQWISLIEENPFFGYAEPKIFMTDDSNAERNALSRVFKTSRILLCQFHIMQAMWRWLWDASHQIDKNDRKHLMLMFRTMVNARTEEILLSGLKTVQNDSVVKLYPQFLKHVEDVMTKANDWALCYRRFLPTRGHNTNNFAESCMRILKEDVLQRKKAFNTTELARHIIISLEERIQNRMLDVAYRRTKAKHNPSIPKETITAEMIEKDSNSGLFFVRSESANESYWVDVDLKICSCPTGSHGNICKHLTSIANIYPQDLQLYAVTSDEERYQLALVAFGPEEAPSREFFGLGETITEGVVKLRASDCPAEATLIPDVGIDKIPISNQLRQELGSVIEAFGQLVENHIESETVLAGLVTMKKSILKLGKVNANTIASAFHCFGKEAVGSIRCKKRGKMIPVQPTSRSRRKESQGRGGSALSKGRPRKMPNTISKCIIKRKHALSRNIVTNKPNGKIH